MKTLFSNLSGRPIIYRSLYIFVLSLLANNAYSQIQLKDGDIIFRQVPCGRFCEAIVETTPCKPGMAFNHCGIVHVENGNTYVIEAVSKGVQQISIQDFLKKDTSKHIYIGRLKQPYTANIPQAIAQATSYIGRPYDKPFLPGDSALYCSELVWYAYRQQDIPVFPLQPMTFKSPRTGATYPAWAEYYQQLQLPMPEGVPGINPCAIANSDKLTLIVIDK